MPGAADSRAAGLGVRARQEPAAAQTPVDLHRRRGGGEGGDLNLPKRRMARTARMVRMTLMGSACPPQVSMYGPKKLYK